MSSTAAVKDTVTLTEGVQNKIFDQVKRLVDEGELSFSTQNASIGFYAAFVAVTLPRFNYSVEATVNHLLELDKEWPSTVEDNYFGYYEDNEELDDDAKDAAIDASLLYIYGGYAFL